MNSDLNKIIEKIDLLRTEVDSYRPLQPEQEQRLLQKFRLDWNFHSSHIEGNTLSYGETKALLLWGITAQGKPLKDHIEIKGHNEAVEYVMDIIKGQNIDITESFIREFHKVIIPEEYDLEAITPDGKPTKRKIKPGQYKSMPNHVMTKSGSMFYFSNPEDTPVQMSELIKWFNVEITANKTHPLNIASLFHYKFVRIHPFDDGNGRMSRLLMNLILMKFGYPPVIIPVDTKEDYYNALQYADAEDIDKFIIFIGERLIESLELWLRAAKGESIEEPDDIDKMVKLLEKKIEWNGLDEEITTVKSVATLEVLNKTTITKLAQEFCIKLNKLNKFFERINILGQYFIESAPKSEYLEMLDHFTKPLQAPNNGDKLEIYDIEEYINKIIKHSNLSGIGFKVILDKMIVENNIKIEKSIAFEFEDNLYKVYYHDSSAKIMQRRYHQQLTSMEIENITNSIFAFCYSIVEKAVNDHSK